MTGAGAITTGKVLADFENWAQDAAGVPASDVGWIPAAVYEQFLAARATDILMEYQKDHTSSNPFTQQTLGCVLLEEVPTEEAPCAPPSGCTWLRTTIQIPPSIVPILSVTGIGGNLELLKTYSYREWDKIKFSLQARIEAERHRGYYTIKNNFLYILDRAYPKAVAVTGIFYDPVEVQRIPPCDGAFDYCKPFLDFSLYIDPGKYQTLLASTYQLISVMRNRVPLDTTNNAQPAVTAEPVKPY